MALIVLVQALFVVLFAAPFAALDFRLPESTDLAIFVVAGLLAAVGQVAYALALSRAAAGRLSAVEYTALLWAALIGYWFFGEIPGLTVWIGSALILGGCVFALCAKAAYGSSMKVNARRPQRMTRLCMNTPQFLMGWPTRRLRSTKLSFGVNFWTR